MLSEQKAYRQLKLNQESGIWTKWEYQRETIKKDRTNIKQKNTVTELKNALRGSAVD